jgi:hypothetical protein
MSEIISIICFSCYVGNMLTTEAFFIIKKAMENEQALVFYYPLNY